MSRFGSGPPDWDPYERPIVRPGPDPAFWSGFVVGALIEALAVLLVGAFLWWGWKP